MKLTGKGAKINATVACDYPCIKQHKLTGTIVLFFCKGTGVALVGHEGTAVGEYSSIWLEEAFEPYYGEVTLKMEAN